MPTHHEQCTVSVIIPVLDPGELLKVQLDALVNQDYEGTFEVIISDNGSTDCPREARNSDQYRDRLQLTVVDSSDIRGAAHARNVGAKHAVGALLLFCDHDDEVHPDWVRRMVAYFDVGPYDLFSSAVESSTLNPGRKRRIAEIAAPENFQPTGVRAPVVVGCSLAARAETYEKLGGMDVTYLANEEVELGWRASAAGFEVGYLPEALVAYRFRIGIRAGYRQGIQRGIWMARLQADFPESGLPPIQLTRALYSLCVLAGSWKLRGEEWGLLTGLSIGSLRGAMRYRTLEI